MLLIFHLLSSYQFLLSLPIFFLTAVKLRFLVINLAQKFLFLQIFILNSLPSLPLPSLSLQLSLFTFSLLPSLILPPLFLQLPPVHHLLRLSLFLPLVKIKEFTLYLLLFCLELHCSYFFCVVYFLLVVCLLLSFLLLD